MSVGNAVAKGPAELALVVVAQADYKTVGGYAWGLGRDDAGHGVIGRAVMHRNSIE
jgi:hypothetical protein